MKKIYFCLLIFISLIGIFKILACDYCQDYDDLENHSPGEWVQVDATTRCKCKSCSNSFCCVPGYSPPSSYCTSCNASGLNACCNRAGTCDWGCLGLNQFTDLDDCVTCHVCGCCIPTDCPGQVVSQSVNNIKVFAEIVDK